MKTLFTISIAMFLFGCRQGAEVISNDGSTDLGYCCISWIECINKFCPNGYDIVKPAPASDQDGIIKCKPSPVKKETP